VKESVCGLRNVGAINRYQPTRTSAAACRNFMLARVGPAGPSVKARASYYNQVRTHLSLSKNTPDFRRPQKLGPIAAISILGGLRSPICQGLSFD
jgi:hypothetical protein